MEVLPPAGGDHDRQPGRRAVHQSRAVADGAQANPRRGGRARPRRTGRVQVLRLLRHADQRRARLVRARTVGTAGRARDPARRQLLHLPGDLVHGRRLPRDGRAREHDGRRSVPELLPARGRRPDRAREGVPAAARDAAQPARRPRRRGGRADHARIDQEGRDRRLPRPRGRRSGVRGPGGLLRAGRAAGLLRLRRPDLLRLLRLHGHRHRPGAAVRVRVPAELRSPVRGARLPAVLAQLAHDAEPLPARLPVHPARRQPQGRACSRIAT